MRAVRLGSLIAAACLFSLPLAATPAHAVTRVYLLRGLADVSVGLDDLAAKLRRHGYPAVVASHSDASAVAARVLSEHKPGDAIIVIGHSLGADASLDVAQTVAAKGRRVELLVAFSPATTGENHSAARVVAAKIAPRATTNIKAKSHAWWLWWPMGKATGLSQAPTSRSNERENRRISRLVMRSRRRRARRMRRLTRHRLSAMPTILRAAGPPVLGKPTP